MQLGQQAVLVLHTHQGRVPLGVVPPAGPCTEMLHIAHPNGYLPLPLFTGAPGLGEVTSGYDSNDVLNMKVTLNYPTGFDATSEGPIHGRV